MTENNQKDIVSANSPSQAPVSALNVADRHIKDTQEVGFPLIDNKDKSFSMFQKKAEKISAALYLVSNFLADADPIKWDLRKLSTGLVRNASSLIFTERFDREAGVHSLKTKVVEIVSLLDVAMMAGLISQMNGSVLKGELALFIEKAESFAMSKNRANTALSSSMFQVEDMFEEEEEYAPEPIRIEPKPAPSPRVVEAVKVSRPIKDRTPMPAIERRTIPAGLLPEVEFEEDKKTKTNRKIKDYSSVAVKRNRRQSFIISILKRRKDLTIKDISSVFHDCSEKTIQRELSALVDEGVISRKGKRRWTRYNLVIAE